MSETMRDDRHSPSLESKKRFVSISMIVLGGLWLIFAFQNGPPWVFMDIAPEGYSSLRSWKWVPVMMGGIGMATLTFVTSWLVIHARTIAEALLGSLIALIITIFECHAVFLFGTRVLIWIPHAILFMWGILLTMNILIYIPQRSQMKQRASMLIIDQQKLLCVHRIKDGREYYVLPGGGVEAGETPEIACVREAMEETGLVVELGEKLAVLSNNGREDHVFRIARFSGTPQLGGPERERQSLTNQYHLEWVDSAQLDRIELVPIEARPICRESLSPSEPR